MSRLVAIVGDGQMGLVLADALVEQGARVRLWGPFPEEIEQLAATRRNPARLPGFVLPDAVEVTADERAALVGADFLLNAIPTQFIRRVWQPSRTGAFAAITDLGVPWHRESFSALDRVTIDDVAQEAALPNKLCDPAAISGDLTGLVLGAFSGRSSPDDRTAFLFRGHALGDLALSVLAWQTYLGKAG